MYLTKKYIYIFEYPTETKVTANKEEIRVKKGKSVIILRM